MPPKGKSTRDAIADAARELFYHKGYTATSYADIGNRSGYGKGNIQYHFNAKDDLLAAAVDRRMDDIRRMLDRWMVECGSDRDRLGRFVDMIEDNAGDIALYGCPMGTLNDELGKVERNLQPVARRMFDLFLDWLEARFRTSLPPDEARDRAEALLIRAQGISVLAHAYNSPDLVRRQVAALRNWLSTTGPS